VRAVARGFALDGSPAHKNCEQAQELLCAAGA
jgi:hypothetical protein